MKISIRYLIALLLVTVTFACSNGTRSANNDGGDIEKTKTIAKNRKFVLPTIPAMLTDSVSRTNYLVAHYWDNFDFNDTTLIHEPDITEQGIVDFLDAFRFVNKENAVASVIAVLKKAEVETTGRMYSYFLETIGEFLYEPNSVVRNEEIYIPVTEYIINNGKSNLAERERAKYLLALMMKNRIGEVASDFEYTQASGKVGTLHEFKAPYTLLFFYSPDCSGCANSIDFVNSSGTAINSAIEGKKLKVLAFYPDNDRQLWIDHIGKIPSGWITGYDRERVVRVRNMYDLKGTPAIYLLDENKRIILKGITIPAVEEYFKRM